MRKPLSVRLSPEQLAFVQEMATEQMGTAAQIVRLAVAAFAKSHRERTKPAGRKARKKEALS
jgi:hypothetical protein